MASSYTTSLRVEKPNPGEKTNTWGTIANNCFDFLEDGIAGYTSIALSDSNYSLTTANGSSDEARNAIINFTGTLTTGRTITIPSVAKVYILKNATTGGHALTISNGGTTKALSNGEWGVFWTDGTDVYRLQVGADVQAYDAGLTSIAGLTTAADRMIYTTASDTYAVATLTSAGRAILDDADAAAQRTTLNAQGILAEGAFVDGDKTKLNGIETSADVTDTTNVTAAGALMDSEVTSLSGIKTLTVPDNTTITAAAKTVLDDASTAAMLTTLGALPTAGGTMSGTLAMADQKITRPQIEDYAETVNAIGSIGGGTQDIDLESGNVVTATVDTSTTTFTFSNPPASGKAGSFTLELINGGSQTVNWPASVTWAGGTAPTLTSSGVDVLSFYTTDGGTTWRGFLSGRDFS